MRYDFDLIVIGSGIAGLTGASMAAGLGKRVAIIERSHLGGKCTWNNCLPLKALIRASLAEKQLYELPEYGLELEDSVPKVSRKKVLQRIKTVIDKVSSVDTPDSLIEMGIKVLFSSPRFVDRHNIEINGQNISSKYFLIATGTSPAKLHIEGIEAADFLDCENFYDQESLPKSIIVMGGGPDGVEFAQALNSLGSKVTLVDMAASILPREDSELSQMLSKHLADSGLTVLTGYRATNAVKEKGVIKVSFIDSNNETVTISADKILTTVGRVANVSGLMLEKAGVTYSDRRIDTDKRLRTTAPNIYATGDVTGPFQLATMAEYQSLNAVNNMFLPLKKTFNSRQLISVVYTDPTFASSGLTEVEAKKQYGKNIRVYRYNYNDIRRAVIDGSEIGIAKVIITSNGKIAGAHIFGNHSEEIIHQLHYLRLTGKRLSSLHAISHAYPSYAEAIIKRIADINYLDQMQSNPFVRLALKILPGFKNNLEAVKNKL